MIDADSAENMYKKKRSRRPIYKLNVIETALTLVRHRECLVWCFYSCMHGALAIPHPREEYLRYNMPVQWRDRHVIPR